MRWNPFLLVGKIVVRIVYKRLRFREYAGQLNQAAYTLSKVIVDPSSREKIGNIPGMLTGIADYLDDLARKKR